METLPYTGLPERFTRRLVVTEGGCWDFPGPESGRGYRLYWNRGKLRSAHRFSYEAAFGPIPDGLVIDHLCKNPSCVFPVHLDAVTQKENLLRGDTFQAKNAAKTHCVNGHEFTPENTAIRSYRPQGGRSCRVCDKEKAARYKARRSVH